MGKKNYKIAYVAFVSPHHTGVKKKICNQIDVWTDEGLIVDTYFDSTSRFGIFKLIHRYATLLSLLFGRHRDYDLIYLRQTQTLPFFSFLLQFTRYVYEVNADAAHENSSLSGLSRLLRKYFREGLIKNSAHVFYVSNELALRLHSSQNGGYSVYPNALFGRPNNEKVCRGNNIVFVGTGDFPWLGLDILDELAFNLSDYNFYVVGDIKYEFRQKNVTKVGPLFAGKYHDFMDLMDYSVGTLAFNRVGINEGSTLKVRDYIFHNLPVIIEYHDTDFYNSEFVFQISPNLTSCINGLRAFLVKWKIKNIVLENEEVLFDNRERIRAKELIRICDI